QIEQFAANRITRRQRCDHAIKRIEEIARIRVPFPALKSFAALVAHYGLGQSAEPSLIIALSRGCAIFDAARVQNVQPTCRSYVAKKIENAAPSDMHRWTSSDRRLDPTLRPAIAASKL